MRALAQQSLGAVVPDNYSLVSPRPLPPFGLLAGSVGNESVSCRRSTNHAERLDFLSFVSFWSI